MIQSVTCYLSPVTRHPIPVTRYPPPMEKCCRVCYGWAQNFVDGFQKSAKFDYQLKSHSLWHTLTCHQGFAPGTLLSHNMQFIKKEFRQNHLSVYFFETCFCLWMQVSFTASSTIKLAIHLVILYVFSLKHSFELILGHSFEVVSLPKPNKLRYRWLVIKHCWVLKLVFVPDKCHMIPIFVSLKW